MCKAQRTGVRARPLSHIFLGRRKMFDSGRATYNLKIIQATRFEPIPRSTIMEGAQMTARIILY